MILIKDMGMPESCTQCEFEDEFNLDMHTYCVITGSITSYENGILKNCPLVEVEPYGIDGLLYKEK